jgi:predicted dehydrogenase
MNYSEACAMVAASRETGCTLGIAYYRRMYPKVNRAKELIRAGAIGRVVFAEATSHDWVNSDHRADNWRVDPQKAGGGPLYDIASHRIDLMNYLFGAPEQAVGRMSTLVHPIPVEDNASVLIEYENGVRALVDVRWHSRIPRDEFRIRGTEGEIELTPLNGATITFPGGPEELPPHPNLHFPCIENFVSAVLDGAELRATGDSSLATDWVTEQVVRGQTVNEANPAARASY